MTGHDAREVVPPVDGFVVNQKHGRYRRTYESFIDSRELAQVSLSAVAVYKMLEVKADDFGNLPGDPAVIRNLISGRRSDLGTEQIEQLVGNLCHARVLVRYEAEGDKWLHIAGWLALQPKNKNGRRVRRFPAWQGEEAEMPDSDALEPGSSAPMQAPTKARGIRGNPGESGGVPVNPGESGGIRVNPGAQSASASASASASPPPPPPPTSPPSTESRQGRGPVPGPGGGGGGGVKRARRGETGADSGPVAVRVAVSASESVRASTRPGAFMAATPALQVDDLEPEQLEAYLALRGDGVGVMPENALDLASRHSLEDVRKAIRVAKGTGCRSVPGTVVTLLRRGMAGSDSAARAALHALQDRRRVWQEWLADQSNWDQVPVLVAGYKRRVPEHADWDVQDLLRLDAFVDHAVAVLWPKGVSDGS